MTRQDFTTTDHLRLEVEVAPTDLVNLAPNPDGALGAWGWLTPAPGSRMTGALAGGLTYCNPTPEAASWFTTEPMPVTPGEYAAAAWVNLPVTTAPSIYSVRFEWLNALKQRIAYSAFGGAIHTDTTGPHALAPQLVPAGAAYGLLRFDINDTDGTLAVAESEIRVTDVKVATAATAGALGSSRVNLLPNPSGETNAVGWLPNNSTVVGRTTAQAWTGNACFTIALTGLPSIPIFPSMHASGIPVTPGRDYTFQFRVRSATATRYARAELYWHDADGNLIYGTGRRATDPTSTTAWTRHWHTATAPSNAATVQVYAGVTSPGMETHYLDGLMLSEGADLPDYFDGATPASGTRTYAWTVNGGLGPAVLTDSTLGSLVPTNWRNILGPAHTLEVDRKALDLGTLTAEVLDAALDPAQTSQLRPGRRVRLLVAGATAGTWEPLFTGKADTLDTTYDEKAQPPKPPRVTLVATDGTTPLTTARRAQGVATVDELPYVLEGAGVPWDVNGSGDQVATATVVSLNDNATALDQVAITRDTRIGTAWVDRRGVLRAYDRAVDPVVPNGDFEAAFTGDGYVFGRAPLYATASRTSSVARSGTGALRLEATSGAATWWYMGVQSLSGVGGMPVVGGRTYTIRAWFRAATTVRACRILASVYQANTLVQSVVSPTPAEGAPVNTTTGWTEVELTFTAAPGAKFLSLTLLVEGTSSIPAGEVHYVDDVAVTMHRRNPRTLDEATYSDVDVTFSSADLINAVTIKLLRPTADGTTEEVVIGPYEDAASVTEWGRRAAEFTVHGLLDAELDAYAQTILERNATPAVRVNAATVPVRNTADLTGVALADLYDEPTVVNAAKGINQTLSVTSVRHRITPTKWLVDLGFADPDAVASPQAIPAVAAPVSTATGYVDLTLASGWTAAGGAVALPQARRLLTGRIVVRGLILLTSGGPSTYYTPVAVLPEGMRPSAQVSAPVSCYDGRGGPEIISTAYIKDTGEIMGPMASAIAPGAYIYLDNIEFDGS